ncbi:MAG: DUF2442 domain-containing protein [Bdellovibrio sp.]|nr:MAG: DUF2442 domain-containing protein [Bdellovibrio sp.]
MSPRAKKVKAVAGYKIEVEFTNGEVKVFDVSQLLDLPVYQPLKNRSYFEKVYIDGGIVQWPNEVDISPDTLYLDSQEVA